MPQSHESRRDLGYNSFFKCAEALDFFFFFNRKVLKIQPSRRVCGRNTCADESHKKRCADSSISSQLNPSSEREREKGWKKKLFKGFAQTGTHSGPCRRCDNRLFRWEDSWVAVPSVGGRDRAVIKGCRLGSHHECPLTPGQPLRRCA